MVIVIPASSRGRQNVT